MKEDNSLMEGFIAGQALIPVPVVGGVIGSLIIGVAGAIGGSKVPLEVYERIEAQINKR